MIPDRHTYDFDNCPKCKGLCLVIGGMSPRRATAYQIIEAARWIMSNPKFGIKFSHKEKRGIKAANKVVGTQLIER